MRPGRHRAAGALALACLLGPPSMAHGDPRPFEASVAQGQAAAVENLILLAVQQGISSLPPTAGQGFQYEWDPVGFNFKRSDYLPPTSFRIPSTIGDGLFSLRVAGSYFGLSEEFGPVDYAFDSPKITTREAGERRPTTAIPGEPSALTWDGYTRNGATVKAEVGILAFSVTYGLSADWEISANLPLTVVAAKADSIYLTNPDLKNQLQFEGVPTRAQIDPALASGKRILREAPLTDLGGRFSDGGVGLGRASLLAKGTLLRTERLGLGLSGELFFPSPSQSELAGSETFAILPRLIAAARLIDSPRVQLHLDLGYDYDFDVPALRRFVWSTGASVAVARATFDLGLAGSKYDKSLRWGAAKGRFRDAPTCSASQGGGAPDPSCAGSYRALGDLSLGSNFVDLLVGGKFQLSDHFVLSANVGVPLTRDGLRPTAAGTLALEYFL